MSIMKDLGAHGKWKPLWKRSAFKTPVFEVLSLDGMYGKETKRFYQIYSGDWVHVIAALPQNPVQGTAPDSTQDLNGNNPRLILISQFRYGQGRLTLEFPGGIVDEEESPEECALRELREETGYHATKALRIASFSPNPALFTNHCHTVVVSDINPVVQETQFDATEDISVAYLTLDELESNITKHRFDNAIMLAGLYSYKNWLQIQQK